jgi:ABC-2 type transport system permease protein
MSATTIAIGNEIDKGLRFGWAERKQILLELSMFVPMFFLFAATAGQADLIVAGRFEWTFDDHRTGWLLVGFAAGMFFFLQAQKVFWRLLGEIQAGTLEQVYLSPLPSWLLTAVGRVLASLLETLLVVGTLYASVVLTVGADIDLRPIALVPVVFLLVGAVGYSLAIGGLTLIWKRIEMLNDLAILVVFFAGGVMVALADLPGWLAPIGRLLPVSHPIEAMRAVLVDGDGLSVTGDGGLLPMIGVTAVWFAAGAVAFHVGDRRARRLGTLTRY